MSNKYTKTPSPERNELKSLYEGGLTQSEIAIKLGTTQKIVWRWMRDLGIKARVPKKRDQVGEKNHMWKAENAGYKALHLRVAALRGKPMKCEECGTEEAKEYEWANLTKKYFDVFDYKRMCLSCHAKFDGKIKNIKHMQTV